ncbi:MAG TPA: CDP-diacylglycerol--serine O-phosphatidyltransferase [Opitutales bacterium]|nr:CDP-diacylglycerol--serine O-phosphatidyltransferase [Opitutales bacterium]
MADSDFNKDIFESTRASRIYFLPNLMTAGNLFCGFVAVIKCIQANTVTQIGKEHLSMELYTHAVLFILAAVVFDIFDGMLARLGGRESLFGKEFDSLADIISFGIAPALMMFFLLLKPAETYPFFVWIGWFTGYIYLLCAAVRLARFNVLTHPAVFYRNKKPVNKDFIGLPVPAAAGAIISLVFFLNHYDLRGGVIILPGLLLLVSWLMVSAIRYPGFKHVDWRMRIRFRTFILLLAAAVLLWRFWGIGLAVIFYGYIFTGLFMHFRRINRRARRLKELESKRSKLVKNHKKDGE